MLTTQLRAVPRPSPVALWAAMLAILYVAAGLVAMLAVSAVEQLVLEPIGIAPRPGTAAWGTRLAVAVLAWGAITAVAGGWLGSRLVRNLNPVRERALGFLGVGILLAALTTYALHELVRARHELFDPEYASWVLFAAPAIVAAALAAWAGAALPPLRRRAFTPVVLVAGAGFAAVTLPGLPGLADGPSPAGLVLGACLAAGAVYVGAILIHGFVDGVESPGR